MYKNAKHVSAFIKGHLQAHNLLKSLYGNQYVHITNFMDGSYRNFATLILAKSNLAIFTQDLILVGKHTSCDKLRNSIRRK